MTTKNKKGHQRSRLRIDPFILLHLLCEQHTTLTELQQKVGFAPEEIKRLRAVKTVHLDTLNRIAEGLNVPPNSLLVTQESPWTVNDGDGTNNEYGFHDAFQVLADYSPHSLTPLFK